MTIDTKNIYKIAAHHRFQWEKAQDCYVILFPEGMVKLNGSAGEVLNLVNGEVDVESITEILSKKFSDEEMDLIFKMNPEEIMKATEFAAIECEKNK